MVTGIMTIRHRTFPTLVYLFLRYFVFNISIFCLVLNPPTNVVTIDVSVTLNVIKCRYPNCQPPIEPALEPPATARPANALYWSNDSDWYFATEGYGGYGKFSNIYLKIV
jgi:hypothetical protein